MPRKSSKTKTKARTKLTKTQRAKKAASNRRKLASTGGIPVLL